MKKNFFFFLASILSTATFSQIYIGKTYEASFFSSAPLENIAAVNKSAQVLLNSAKNEVAIKITIKGFTFEKKLMQEHFNEKYMESDKYPTASFSGTIQEQIDYSKDGTHNVNVKGKLNIHGVEKERTIPGTIAIKNGELTINTKFNVALKDYNIEIPSIVVQNIAESVEVKFNATLTAYKPQK